MSDITWTNEKRKLGEYVSCVDCGDPKLTKKQRIAPRCHVCENKRRAVNIVYFACPICGKPKNGRGRSDRILCKTCSARARWRSQEHRKKITAAAVARFGAKSLDYRYVNFTNEIREFVRDRHERKCAICGVNEGELKLDVHHIDYDKTNSAPSNLIALCHSCHMRTNNNRNYWTKLCYETVS